MALFSQKIEERTDLKEGDHIYTWRKRIYSHHGIFIGNDKVIHFVNPKGKGEGSLSLMPFIFSSSVMQKTPCSKSYCGLEKVPGSGVKLSCIDCFISKGSLYLFKYQVSLDFLFLKGRGGTCTTAKSDTPQEVIHRATYLHEKGYGEYDLKSNNCEDFALYCKTGLWSNNIEYQGRSSQVNMVHPKTKDENDEGMVGTVLRMVTAIPRSFSKREDKDLGIREDVVNVPVEELSSFRLALKYNSFL
uniref:protein LEAD-SENSITIVE 1-like n=1 Tax=Erigeron canadensis TaxID=72917 RepID=UPI001CB92F77|nr:protein LEAD-SENSITIVE 1-like [Erigeron canadensis]